MSGSVTAFYGAVVTPVDARSWKALPRCLLVVGVTGNIEFMMDHVEKDKLAEVLIQEGYATAERIILPEGKLIIPGFIDTHTHAAQFPTLGKGGQFQLLDWLNEVIFPNEARFKDVDFARKVYRQVIRRSLDCGTTTSCYFGSLHLEATKILAGFANELGQRAFVGKCNMDFREMLPDFYREDSADESIKETRELIDFIRQLRPKSEYVSIGTAPEPLVQPILTPRFALACTDELMRKLGSLADEHDKKHPNEPRMRIQTHISENKQEVLDVEELYDQLYAEVYDTRGLLRETTILAHDIYLTGPEIDLIKKREAGIAHCPTSNFYLTSGVAPIGKYLDEGLKIGLGTDVSGGYAVSMLTTIQNASTASKLLVLNEPAPVACETAVEPFAGGQLKVPTLFYLATLGGAEVCNLAAKVGSFSRGKSFDALLVSTLDDAGAINLWGMEAKTSDNIPDSERYEAEKAKLEENLERFLFCGDDRSILNVYVQGRLVGGKSFKK